MTTSPAAPIAAPRSRTLLWLGIVLAALVASLLGGVDAVLDGLGRSALHASNRAYLARSADEATETLLVLSSLESGLHLLRTSRAGLSIVVDVEVQVGEILQPLTDLVGRAALASLVSLAALSGLDLLLDLASSAAAPLLSLFLALVALRLLTDHRGRSGSTWRQATARLARLILLLALAAHVLVPLAVSAASWLSHEITADGRGDVHDAFGRTHAAVTGDAAQDEGTRDRVESAFHRYEAAIESIPDRTREMAKEVPRHCALIAFDVFLFPLGTLWILVGLGRRLITPTPEREPA